MNYSVRIFMRRAALLLLAVHVFLAHLALGQERIYGKIVSDSGAVVGASVNILELEQSARTDTAGSFLFSGLEKGRYHLQITHHEFDETIYAVSLPLNDALVINLKPHALPDYVVRANRPAVAKQPTILGQEVYNASFFRKSISPTLIEMLQHVNGVRPQVSCNVCNTSEIQINGLEGPYTMVLIDGMPIMGALASVYGFSGIPRQIIDRVEITKGPAATLYGSEAVGGVINILTRSAQGADSWALDVQGTSWREWNADFAHKLKIGKKVHALLAANYFHYMHAQDLDKDYFTDVALQQRWALFNKWHFSRPQGRMFNLAARYVYEDRWGGELQWKRQYRGTQEAYAESIFTHRLEMMGNYQLPVQENMQLQFSGNMHRQNSAYGDRMFLAEQRIFFGQLLWDKPIGGHALRAGLAYRYSYYDDNTPATGFNSTPMGATWLHSHLPGLFVEDSWSVNHYHQLMGGLRYDYHNLHGNIFSPRLGYKWHSRDENTIIRIGTGSGYRVAHIFSEDHAALSGAREIMVEERLRPERSWAVNASAERKLLVGDGIMSLDASLFYTHFFNKIVPDYDTDPNKIIFGNLNGFAVSKGMALMLNWQTDIGWSMQAGATLKDVYTVENEEKQGQLFSERFSATWALSYNILGKGLTIDYTGNVYSPMRLPLLGALDPRPEYSPWWSVHNLQLTKAIPSGPEIIFGVKNLLNWTPAKAAPFLIARAHDPFDKQVVFDADGAALPSPDNPYALTFDPGYSYAPNQGRRWYVGLRWQWNKN